MYVARIELKFGTKIVPAGTPIPDDTPGMERLIGARHVITEDEFRRLGGVVLDEIDDGPEKIGFAPTVPNVERKARYRKAIP